MYFTSLTLIFNDHTTLLFSLTLISFFVSQVMLSHFTQTTGGVKACVFKLTEYHAVLRQLKAEAEALQVEEIPWATFNVVERLSHSVAAGRWTPVRPEHLADEEVERLIAKLPRTLLDVLLPFQHDGLRFALRRGARCLIADDMGLGKTLQVTKFIVVMICVWLNYVNVIVNFLM